MHFKLIEVCIKKYLVKKDSVSLTMIGIFENFFFLHIPFKNISFTNMNEKYLQFSGQDNNTLSQSLKTTCI